MELAACRFLLTGTALSVEKSQESMFRLRLGIWVPSAASSRPQGIPSGSGSTRVGRIPMP
jgi:hypothetical protein